MRASEKPDFKTRLQDWLPRLVLSPSIATTALFVYGFILFTFYMSFTNSRMLPNYDWVGLKNYVRLWDLSHWWVSITNLGIFASLYIVICRLLALHWLFFWIRKSGEKGCYARSISIRWRCHLL